MIRTLSRSSLLLAVAFLLPAALAWAQAQRLPTPRRSPPPSAPRWWRAASSIPGAWRSCPTAACSSPSAKAACGMVGTTAACRTRSPACPKVFARGQGGLLDVALSPSFANDRLVYLSFSEPGEGGAGTAVARGRLGDGGLEDVQVIWRQVPKSSHGNHWGSRLVFARDGTLFVTTGDRQTERERAQDLASTIGKVVRINADGSIPADNPFVAARRRAAGDLVLRPSQPAGRGAASADRPAVDGRARRARRRRTQPSASRQELRLAGDHLRRRLLRLQDRRRHGEGRAWSSRSTTGIR